MTLIEILLLALSLSVDSFVVSMSGSVTLGSMRPAKMIKVAFVFGFVQAFFLYSGWLLGSSVVGYVEKIAHPIAFLLLLYIGGGMLVSALKGQESEKTDLSGLKHLFLAAIATSIDAAAVGVSLAMSGFRHMDIGMASAAVLAVTMLASMLGISGGCALGRRFGRPARVAGGIALISIGIGILIG